MSYYLKLVEYDIQCPECKSLLKVVNADIKTTLCVGDSCPKCETIITFKPDGNKFVVDNINLTNN